MNWIWLVYFLLGSLLFFGAKLYPRGEWNEDYTSRDQTKVLTGIMALGVVFHHLAQKTCASWIPSTVRVHGLDIFLDVGFPTVAVFLFCSALGLYRSLHSKPDYLKGFFRRRILPIAVAFYLSEWIYTAVRLLMGEKMDLAEALWYMSGLRMANTYSWYVIVIPFFYLVFWAAFRFCKREGFAILWVFLFTLAYTVLGTLIDHQSTWWMRGEWWYNSIILFPLGLLFGKYEKPITRFFRRGYLIWLLLSAAAVVLLYLQSDWLISTRWGYYGEGTVMKIPHRLMSAGMQWLVCVAFVAFCFLLMNKVRFGNRALAWLGAMSLEFYLMHGLFVELFGYSFLDAAQSLVRIKDVPLYIAAVMGCSVPAALVFRRLCGTVCGLMAGKGERPGTPRIPEENGTRTPEKIRRLQEKYRRQEASSKARKFVRYGVFPALLVILFVCVWLFMRQDPTQSFGGLIISPPGGFSRTASSPGYSTWEYKENDQNPGILILDEEIKGIKSQYYKNVDEVLEECTWLTEAELYVNPHGIRMARGFSIEFSDYPERRYYVECDTGVFLIRMIEDSRYYDPADCEAAMKETADGIRRR